MDYTLSLADETVVIKVDPEVAAILGQLTPGGWRRFESTISLSTRKADRMLLDLAPETARTISLNYLVFWKMYGEWPERGMMFTHKNKDPLDFQCENLRHLTASEHRRQLRDVTPPAAPDKGITELPGGQFKVRAYDPATKKSKYVGLRNTREEAVELKRQFLAGEAKFGGNPADAEAGLHRRGEVERVTGECADHLLREELKEVLLTALARGSDALHGIQRLIGPDLVRLKLLHPDIRFLDSQGQITDRIVEIPVEIPS